MSVKFQNYVVFPFVLAVLLGLIALASWVYTNDVSNSAVKRQEQCYKMAELAGATDHVERDRYCYMVIEGELQTVNVTAEDK